MAHFITGCRGRAKTEPSLLGTKKTGVSAHVASWHGSCHVRLFFVEKTGIDMCEVNLEPWNNAGINKILFFGPVDVSKLVPVDEFDGVYFPPNGQ